MEQIVQELNQTLVTLDLEITGIQTGLEQLQVTRRKGEMVLTASQQAIQQK